MGRFWGGMWCGFFVVEMFGRVGYGVRPYRVGISWWRSWSGDGVVVQPW